MNEKSKHTPGPWKAYGQAIYTEAKRAHWVFGRDALQSLVANVRDNYDEDPENVIDNPPSMAEAEANTSRIVACVNGCEGIADPSAVKELLEALEGCLGPLQDEYNRAGHTGHETAASRAFVLARAAIGKARGEKGGGL